MCPVDYSQLSCAWIQPCCRTVAKAEVTWQGQTVGRNSLPGLGTEVEGSFRYRTELQWKVRHIAVLLANFPAKSRKSSARQWLPRVRPWLEAIAKMLFLTKICVRTYLLTPWLGIFSRSSAQGVSLLPNIGGSQPTLCSGYKGPGRGQRGSGMAALGLRLGILLVLCLWDT